MAYVIGNDCVACGTCIDECPVGAISAGDDKYSINPDMCTECGTCAGVCPSEAISLPEGTCQKRKKDCRGSPFFCAQQEMSYSPFS